MASKRYFGEKNKDVALCPARTPLASIVLPIIFYLGYKLSKWLAARTENEKIKEYILQINDSVTSAVRATFQTYVDSLKESNKFDKAAQKEALEKIKSCILSSLSDNLKQYIQSTHGDLDSYIETHIEAKIDELKNE